MACSGEEIPESSTLGVDKRLLAKAVELGNDKQLLCYSYGKQLLPKDVMLHAIKVADLGDIPIPVSIEDLKRLKGISEPALCGKGCNRFLDPLKIQALKIESSKVLSPKDLDLSSLIVSHLGLPVASINVQAKLAKLILYETGGHYKHDYNFEKKIGTFGTAILQLPVECGHEGGRVTVEYEGAKKLFESHQDSDKHFFLSAYYGNSDHSMEQITRGWKLALVFNLVLNNCKISVEQEDFPVVFAALKDIEEALAPWIPQDPHQTGNNPPIENVPDCMISVSETGEKIVSPPKKKVKPTKKKYKRTDDYDSDVDNEFDDLWMDFDNFNDGDGPAEGDVLYFVLKENYQAQDFKFDCIQGADLKLANILLSCRFLDVHLAVVKDKSENHDYLGRSRYKQHTMEIPRWIDSKNVSKNLSMGISWRDQLVGSLGKLLTFDNDIGTVVVKLGRDKGYGDSDYEDDSHEEDSDEENDTDDDRSVFCTQYSFILVIWPKDTTFLKYCRYDLHSLLNNLENSMSLVSTMEGSEETEGNLHLAMEDFKKIMSVCCAEPDKTWGEWVEKDEQKGDLTSRLLRFCITLRAREEGLAILKILGVDFEPESKFCRVKPFEGIKSEKVAKAIADFECQITGWEGISDLIKPIISPQRVFIQLAQICKLAQYFLEVECLDGAIMVGNQISLSLASLKKSKAAELKRASVESTLNLFLLLETDPKTSNRERLATFITLFPKLNHLLQCRLVLDLDLQRVSRFKNVESSQFLFDELCKALLTSEIFKNPSENFYYEDGEDKCVIGFIKDMIVDLLKLYILSGNSEWLQLFISKICCEPETSKTHWLRILLSSPVIWELGSSSEFKSANCLECYRVTCNFFLDQDFVSLVNDAKDVKLKIFRCLLRLKDRQFWETFASKVCASFASEKSNGFVRVILKNVELQQAIVKSVGFRSCIRMLDYWLLNSKSLKKPVFDWCQPEASLSSHPEVEVFLRSSEKRLIYHEFRKLAECYVFANELERMGTSNGFSVEVKSNRKVFDVRCKITKTKGLYEQSKKDFLLRKSELPELLQLRRNLVVEREKLKQMKK